MFRIHIYMNYSNISQVIEKFAKKRYTIRKEIIKQMEDDELKEIIGDPIIKRKKSINIDA